jgi:HlyD family secretion protein
MKNSFSQYIKNIKSFAVAHKVWTGLIVAALVFLGYHLFSPKTSTETRYVTGDVSKGTVIVSISGSGQVSATNTIDLQAKASKQIVAVNVKEDQTVRKGAVLFSLESKDAQKALRDATLNLTIAQNDLANAKSDYTNIKTAQELSLKNSYLTLNSEVAAVPDDNNLSTDILTTSGSYNSTEQGRYTLEVYACQKIVCINYSGMETGSFSVEVNVPKMLGTRGLYVAFTTLPKSGEKWYIDVPSPTSTSYLSNSRSYAEKEESVRQAIENAQKTITARELAVAQRENALEDARATLSDYYVFAPFDGKIANITGKVGEIASGSLGKIITKEKIAEISLNEVDVAKIKLGDKATLTFDAIDGLSIAGEVASIDSIGTVTQGVVTYVVKINFATEDDRIKPGMSTSAEIVSAVAQDVLTVPTSAVKTKNGVSYIEMFDAPLVAPTDGTQGTVSSTLPRQQTVEIGLSNSSVTEITSGLKEGDQVVTRTVSGTTVAKATTAQAPTLFGAPNNRGGAAGARVQGR